MAINLNNITNFLKPNRQVWQDAVPASVRSKPQEKGLFGEITDKSIAEFMEAADFKKKIANQQGKSMCDRAQSVECSLGEMKDIQEVARFKTLVDGLYEKFLLKMEGGVNIEDSFQRLQKLKKSCDMKRILECFQKAESYEIKAYSMAEWERNPDLKDKIIFTYKDGKTETIDLELKINIPQQEKAQKEYADADKISNYASGVFDMVTSSTEEESEKAIETLNAMLKKKDQEQRDKDVRNTEELIERASNLNTPNAAYSELVRIAPNLPSSFLEDISEPLSQYADIISRYEAVSGTIPELTPEHRNRGENLLQNVQDILITHFGDDYKENMSEQQLTDLFAISERFGMM